MSSGVELPDGVAAKAQEVIGAHSESFAKAVAAGVQMAMGTDSGVAQHGQNLRELTLMAEGGMAPAEVLVAATSSAASLLGMRDEAGTLRPGKRADIVAVGGDPLDLANLKANVRAVYKDGRLVRGGAA